MNDRMSDVMKLIHGYAWMVTERISAGWKPTLITVMFNHLPGSEVNVSTTMRGEVERIYDGLVTYNIRNARSTPNEDLPMWICCPDYAVYKRDRQHFANIAQNDGRHYHIIALTPPWTRLNTELWQFIANMHDKLRGTENLVSHIHARSIEDNPEFVVDYGMKSIKTRRVSQEEVLILPRAKSELPLRKDARADRLSRLEAGVATTRQ